VIGRVYVLRGEHWRVVCRWRGAPVAERSAVCPGCGQILDGAGRGGRAGEWICACVPMPDMQVHGGGVRNVLLEELVPYYKVAPPGTILTLAQGHVLVRGEEPRELVDMGPGRMALAVTGRRMVRPFRGLRRA
jgi:hypothetical protein